VIAPVEISAELPRRAYENLTAPSPGPIRSPAGAGMRARIRFAALSLIVFANGLDVSVRPAVAQVVAQVPAATCEKKDFEGVVENAALALRDLNARNAPGFQDKLRLLRDRRKWSAEEFMEKAAPFVQDERIADYDQRSTALLNRINSMGEAGAASNTPDCKLLEDLRTTMKALIDTQIEKWAYMFAKIERGLVN
jgi:hypothetical protein